MKIIFAAYRDWALKVYPYLKGHPKVTNTLLCQTTDELYSIDLTEYDLLITLGLSDMVEGDVYNKIPTIGLHCAELDRYSYGSPIQNQVIDGILKTKHRVFRLGYKSEKSRRSHAHTREFSDEVDLYLHGGIKEIFEQLTYTSIPLLNSFIDRYPNNYWKQWPEESIVRERRKPADSSISWELLSKMSTEEVYNLVRCLEDPYPNLFIEDDQGILYFKQVMYRKK